MVRENLGNFALRLWLALAGAAALALAVLPALAGLTAGRGEVFLAGILVLVCFFLSGRVLDRTARSWAEYWVRQAAVRDQAGMEEDARLAFDRAMAILDGWMPSPALRKRLGLWLGSRMANFVMARQDPTPEDMERVTAYLRDHPDDLDTVQGWLQWQAAHGGRHHIDNDLLEMIAARYPDNIFVQKALAGLFMKTGRTDFIAMATYKKLLQKGDRQAVVLKGELARMLENGRRPDQRALDAGSVKRPAPARLDSGPVRLDSGADEKQKTLLRTENSAAGRPARILGRAVRPFPVALTAAAILAVAGCFVLIAFFHRTDQPGPGADTGQLAAQAETDRRFTIQVAAYLKEEDAARYVKRLQQKGYDAFYTRAGRDRKKWYQVKISRFATMAEARAFGSKLKKQGIIDDFYIANYKH